MYMYSRYVKLASPLPSHFLQFLTLRAPEPRRQLPPLSPVLAMRGHTRAEGAIWAYMHEVSRKE